MICCKVWEEEEDLWAQQMRVHADKIVALDGFVYKHLSEYKKYKIFGLSKHRTANMQGLQSFGFYYSCTVP